MGGQGSVGVRRVRGVVSGFKAGCRDSRRGVGDQGKGSAFRVRGWGCVGLVRGSLTLNLSLAQERRVEDL